MLEFLDSYLRPELKAPVHLASRCEPGAFEVSGMLEALKQHRSFSRNLALHSFLSGANAVLSNDDFEKIHSASSFHDLRSLEKSLRITNIQLVEPGIKAFCDGVFRKRGKVLTCNLYFTPNSSSQCFTFHSDQQISIVVQLLGEKNWTLLKSDSAWLREKSAFNSTLSSYLNQKLHAESQHFLLKEGDIFIVPQNLIHSAENLSADPSLHITFAFTPPTVGQFLRYCGNLILQNSSESEPRSIAQLQSGFLESRQTLDLVTRSLGRNYEEQD